MIQAEKDEIIALVKPKDTFYIFNQTFNDIVSKWNRINWIPCYSQVNCLIEMYFKKKLNKIFNYFFIIIFFYIINFKRCFPRKNFK